MDAQGVIFAKKANTPSLLLYIVDGSQKLDASTKDEMQKQIAKGAGCMDMGTHTGNGSRIQ